MLQKSILTITFAYQSTYLNKEKIKFEFTYDALKSINLFEKLKSLVNPYVFSSLLESENSDNLEINEINIITALNALISLKKELKANLTASPSELFEVVLTKGLEKNKCNSSNNYQFFLHNITPVVALYEKKKLCANTKEFHCSL